MSEIGEAAETDAIEGRQFVDVGETSNVQLADAQSETPATVEKRPRGRPRKYPPAPPKETAQPKRGRGRPRKYPVGFTRVQLKEPTGRRSRGRPRKNPLPQAAQDGQSADIDSGTRAATTVFGARNSTDFTDPSNANLIEEKSAAPANVEKRRLGRPHKYPLVPTTESTVPKRGPGRPRKNPPAPTKDSTQPKRGRGRPRKYPVETGAVQSTRKPTGRPRGRPKKNPVEPIGQNAQPGPFSLEITHAAISSLQNTIRRKRKSDSMDSGETGAKRARTDVRKEPATPVTKKKRGPGRPRKYPLSAPMDTIQQGRGPGRPRKYPAAVQPGPTSEANKPTGRRRGRPRKNPVEQNVQNIPSAHLGSPVTIGETHVTGINSAQNTSLSTNRRSASAEVVAAPATNANNPDRTNTPLGVGETKPTTPAVRGKRGPGRPRKYPPAPSKDTTQPKRPRGRPRKYPVADVPKQAENPTRRPRGRPRKNNVQQNSDVALAPETPRFKIAGEQSQMSSPVTQPDLLTQNADG